MYLKTNVLSYMLLSCLLFFLVNFYHTCKYTKIIKSYGIKIINKKKIEWF